MKTKKPPRDDKQKAFVREYVKDCNGTQAAIRAGYSKKTAKEQAARLLTKVNIQEEVSALLSKILKQAKIPLEKKLFDFWLVRATYALLVMI